MYLKEIQKLKDDKGHLEYLLHNPEEGNDGGSHSMVPLQSTLIVQFLRRFHALATKDLKGYHILYTYLPKRLMSIDLGLPPMLETLIATNISIGLGGKTIV